MKATEFDQLFDEGKEDVMDYLEVEQAQRTQQAKQSITFELPLWMLESLDKEASRLGETRQSLIKFSLCDKLAAHQNLLQA